MYVTLTCAMVDSDPGNRQELSAALAKFGVQCIAQLAGSGLPVVHTVELLDWMNGGPRPPTLAQLETV